MNDNFIFSSHVGFKDISKELDDGFAIFEKGQKLISVFGSARVGNGDPMYHYAESVGAEAAKMGYGVITGGGPGLMEAASRGCFLNNGVTYGINIKLPKEQDMNPYIQKSYLCSRLFTRKILLTYNSCGFIIMPGGFGTLDELFEVVTLVSTSLMKPVPIVLAGSSFWQGLLQWVSHQLVSSGYITSKELGLITVADLPQDIIKHIDTFNF